MSPVDQLVENIVLQAKLVSSENMEKAKALLVKNPELNLLTVLLKTELINQEAAKKVQALVQKQSDSSAPGSETSSGLKPGDKLVENIVLQAKLVSSENMEKAKALLIKNPELNLLTVLLKTGLINEEVAKKVQTLVQQQSKASASAPGRTTAPSAKEPAPAAPPAAGNATTAVRVEADGIKGMSLLALLELATEQDASDLHIHVDFPAVLRKNGVLEKLGDDPYLAEETERLIFDALNEEQKEKLNKEWSLDTCLEIKGVGRYRTTITRQRLGWDGAFHIVKSHVPTFEDLGLPETLKRLTEYPQGLVLLGGPTGSGKSSTLAAMVNHINLTRNEHIITLEDPVEYLYKPEKSHVSQRQVGDNTLSYSNALRGALREDPDVIMLGELRDVETASLAISASETGHLVFTTLHTTSSSKTVNRVLDLFPPAERFQIRSMISQSLRGVVCQKLVPRADGNGRVLALEIMFNTPAVGNLINKDNMLQLPSVMQTGAKLGMQLMDARLKEMVNEKLITEEEAYFAAENPKLFKTPPSQLSGTI